MQTYLDFEKGLAEIEGKAEELRTLARRNAEMNVDEEAAGARPEGRDDARRALPEPRSVAQDARSRAIPSGRIARTTSTRCSASGRRWPATATSPTTTR